MNKFILATAAVLLYAVPAANAQTCTPTPSCENLGYNDIAASCTTFGLSHTKCPFDQAKVACNGKVPPYSTAQAACEAEGYKFTAAQCGVVGPILSPASMQRQIGVRCPYDNNYYSCQYPSQDAQVGWYICGDGTASANISDCGVNFLHVAGLVISAPSYFKKGVVALRTPRTGVNGLDAISECASGYTNLKGMVGEPRAPSLIDLDDIYQSRAKFPTIGTTLTYPLWQNLCWGSSGVIECKAMNSSGKIITIRNDQTSSTMMICVAYF